MKKFIFLILPVFAIMFFAGCSDSITSEESSAVEGGSMQTEEMKSTEVIDEMEAQPKEESSDDEIIDEIDDLMDDIDNI